MMYLEVAGGLVLLLLGGEMLVRGAVSLARRLGVSALVIGLTVVGFGTSAPEAVVSIGAVLKGVPDIAVGNVVGSNIANILLVLGVAVLIFPIACDPRSVKRDGYTLLATTAIFVLAAWTGSFERWMGIVMLGGLAGYLAYCYRDEHGREASDPAAELHIREAEEIETLPGSVWVPWATAGAGILVLVVGADFLVEGGVELARALGVSEAVIGLTLIAVGTSLPELATAVVAALRRHTDVVLGNVIGSNMFNLLGVLGAAALVHPVAVAEKFLRMDLWIMLGVTIAGLLFMVRGWRLSRTDAAILLIGYVLFLAGEVTGVLGVDAVQAAAQAAVM